MAEFMLKLGLFAVVSFLLLGWVSTGGFLAGILLAAKYLGAMAIGMTWITAFFYFVPPPRSGS